MSEKGLPDKESIGVDAMSVELIKMFDRGHSTKSVSDHSFRD